MANDEILTGNESYLESLRSSSNVDSSCKEDCVETRKMEKIPALQPSGVVGLAFGTGHFHALHSDGSITSYGARSHVWEKLGLGSPTHQWCRGRSVFGSATSLSLLPQCYTTGRRVIFEAFCEEWLRHMANTFRGEMRLRPNHALNDESVVAEVSEWFENRLRNWERDAPRQNMSRHISKLNDDSLPLYFAFNIAAGECHSVAQVLVNEEKAEKIRKRYTLVNRKSAPVAWTWEEETFPLLKLKDGTVMPGDDPVLDWKCPEFEEY